MARILLIDDEEYLRDSIQNLLEAYGHAVCVAADGEEALELLKKNTEQFDLIVSDYRMPHKDGLELLQQVKADCRFGTIPFILMSGSIGVESRLKAACQKADVIFALKPSYNLMELVNKALGPP